MEPLPFYFWHDWNSCKVISEEGGDLWVPGGAVIVISGLNMQDHELDGDDVVGPREKVEGLHSKSES